MDSRRQPKRSHIRYDNRSYSEKVAGTKKGLLFAVKISKPLRFVFTTKTQFVMSFIILLVSVAVCSFGVILIKNSKDYKQEDMVDTFKEDEEYWNIKYMPQLEALNISVVIDPDLYNKLNKDILSF